MSTNSESNMPTTTEARSPYRPLQIWFPILSLFLMAIARFIPGLVPNGPGWIWMVSAFGPFLASFAILLWWLFASRANWKERLLGLVGIIAILTIVLVGDDPSMRGPLTTVMTIPMMFAGFTVTLIALSKNLSMRRTLIALVAALLLASVSMLIKTTGVRGNFAFDLSWRWKATAEEKLLESLKKSGPVAKADPIAPSELTKTEWPSFRGPNQDGAQHGCVISDDWANKPPKELWRIPIGPAWSSFVSAGHYLFTQEQRGEFETVVCYDANDGKQVWEATNKSRFFEALGGLGPRSTPTLADGFIYTLGADGVLQKLSASSGERVWEKNIQKLADRTEPPMWGFSSSPLVYQGMVIVHAGGEKDKGILALDSNSGELKWSAAAGVNSYSSVQTIRLLGKPYLLLLSDEGAHILQPEDGKIILDYKWKHNGYRALQAQVLEDDKILIPTGLGTGTRLIQVSDNAGKLEAKVLWTSKSMKPDFNDLVVHKGFAYGFDNLIFGCIDLATGKEKWRGGRYEKGQALLLADSDLILIVSEIGDLALVRATPDDFQEIIKLPAMEGKTWNHPVVINNRLYIRNSEEAVCYELPVK